MSLPQQIRQLSGTNLRKQATHPLLQSSPEIRRLEKTRPVNLSQGNPMGNKPATLSKVHHSLPS